ncbi:hypothetical protein TPHA_0F00460 [Tetrapisispora phaffii CBS 4417]|uniref:Phosphatidylethanolamine N-methyltransferase n=1 Tax=Tetrapisispora phaffii (strain ATCC 24235 / CBS 4417 / NBRC 1672 / NRRL Y-8282 / UCD 70-5) TaxID=1071381 RepID=G8BUV1_TETPH|nr:hypothetical protein TPHA_0F00460 [Tetrapisispora phaffii CBS 4417]CCE63533.1 hypothetical protein TPHA_0F00460 [Tetrapisispora phaffii CBS 4417]
MADSNTMVDVKSDSVTVKTGDTCRTRSSGVMFTPKVTHDMVRSLFDPTIRKSFLEYCVTLTVIGDILVGYWIGSKYSVQFAKYFFLVQYTIWRLAYNVGIGHILHQQSKYEILSNFAIKNKLFDKKNNSNLSRFCKFELQTKLGEEFDIESYPPEYLIWLMFRQFVDLILMQDFTNYIIFVYFSLPDYQGDYVKSLLNFRTLIGIIMVMLNVWIKLDAHRVVTDYAWYWGDFFSLQDSELTFDGVFNIVPHPMYSLGYLGYYGFSLLCGDYKVLLVSIWGHILQFLFLKYVENPHIEKIYGSSKLTNNNDNIDDIIIKENNDYTKPLISNGLYFENFQLLRFTDVFTLASVIYLCAWVVKSKPGSYYLFIVTAASKLLSWSVYSALLYKQSQYRSYTKAFLKNGFTQIYSYKNWQFIYNYLLSITTTLLILQTLYKLYENYHAINTVNIIFGIIVCVIQIWCNYEIRQAISDFGYFYGDFFLTNYIIERKLTSQGIFRYLNNPDAFLSNCGVLGSALMTNFNHENITLVGIWITTNLLFNKFIEQPHVDKVYGKNKRKAGVEKSLLKIKPIKSLLNVLDSLEAALLNKIIHEKQLKDSHDAENLMDWGIAMQDTIRDVKTNLAPNCLLKVESNGSDKCILPNRILVSWQLPSEVYDTKDWIGLYNVLSTRSDYKKTKISSFGHWSATCKNSYKADPRNSNSVNEFRDKGSIIQGTVIFDNNLLVYEPGIYEFRYHSKNSHNVFLISQPIQIEYPKFETDNPERLFEDFKRTLINIGSLLDNKFDGNGNKYFNIKAFVKFIHYSTGIELSTDYIKNVNGDIETICNRICEIKKILNDFS